MQTTMTRAAHRPRRTRHADRLGGHHRRKGGLLPGEVLPPEGPLLRGCQAQGATPERRLDGSHRAAHEAPLVPSTGGDSLIAQPQALS